MIGKLAGVHYAKACCAGILTFWLLASCSPPPELIGIDNPEAPAASVEQAKRHKVFIATTRQSSEMVGAFYSGQRAPELGLASVTVSIPPSHVAGELRRPSRLPPDPRTEFAIVDPATFGSDEAFIASINRELAKRPPKDRDILFFVHGFNNTASDALLRVGQFVEDTGFQGVPVLFSWASAGKTTRYVYDLNSALVARPKLIEAGELLARTDANGFDIFAHSMGTLLTMEAVLDQAQNGRLGSIGRLKAVVLAAPDIDVDLFQTQMAQIGEDRARFYVLLSQDDAALKVSRRLAGGVPRVGASDIEFLSQFGVTAIDLSEIADSSSGSHSKYAGSPEVVQLIGRGLANDPGYGHTSPTELDEILGQAPIRVVFD
ncbi:alpha/beta hydrolase [Pseudoruegeria sp. SHC-113]|uniref:alpha/beta hydrolase n=1 Tax=Pseudoruegeria sp. SHC-113 TaxID=2855439 RepID=UPI0021BBB650|nr:alpha/beta hydrolase [Pseudoruegeria sp. SHC-113]MCT8161290.1 alpha/beta hydrolase [Pseudoruegeria sp. SHC-113]